MLLFERTTPFSGKIVDPALLTFDEYYRLVNKQGKTHPDDAYTFSVQDRQKWDHEQRDHYPQLLRRIRINGIVFEIRLRKVDRWDLKYFKWDPVKLQYLKNEHDQMIPLTREEIEKTVKRRWEYSIGVFTKEDGYVGGSADEWGTMLIRVAEEYRGFGLGPIIGKIARSFEPEKDSGGFTAAGAANLRKVHRAFVRNYMTSGMYSFLVRSGQITAERAKAIIQSVGKPPAPKPARNLGSDDPSDWLLYVGQGDFIIYDKKLRDVIDDEERFEFFAERMIKGMVYAYVGKKYARIRVFGGDTPKIKSFLMTLAAIEAKAGGVPLVVEPEDLQHVDRSKIDVVNERADVRAGYDSHRVEFAGQPMNLRQLGLPEQRFRKAFDRYDEFKARMQEMAYAKYR